MDDMTKQELLDLKAQRFAEQQEWRAIELSLLEPIAALEPRSDKWTELQARKHEAHMEQRAIRAELIEIESFISALGVAEHDEARIVAFNTPGAVFAEIEGVAAAAFSGAGEKED